MAEKCIVVINEVSNNSIHIHPLFETFHEFLQSLASHFNIERNDIKSIEYTLTDPTRYVIEEENDYFTMKSLFIETKLSVLCIYITTTDMYISKQKNKPSKSDKKLEELSKQLDQTFLTLKGSLLEICKEFIKKEEQSYVNFYRTCSKCEENIIGRLYKCTICKDYYLCDNCLVKNSEKHFHSHTFIVILNNESYKIQLEQMEKDKKIN